MADIQVANTSAQLSGKTLLLGDTDATITALHTFSRSTSAPFAVNSGAGAVANLDADKLDGQEGSYYTNAANLTGSLPSAILGAIYPVGIVITLGVSTNPNTLFGFGTWSAIAGRVIVGIDAGQTEFDTLDETGGSKTHTLTESELPSHTHTVTDPGHSHTQRVKNSGGATVDLDRATDRTGADANVTSTTASATTGITLGNTGSGSAHNNLQPYIVKYVWQRTA